MSRSSSSGSVPLGTQSTTRREDGVVMTKLVGRVDVALIQALGDAYCKHGGRDWLVDAMDVATYAPAVVGVARTSFSKWAERGLGRLCLVTQAASIRMAAASIRLPVRFASGVDIVVFDSMEDAERALRNVP